jgi:hypothetical protein
MGDGDSEFQISDRMSVELHWQSGTGGSVLDGLNLIVGWIILVRCTA